MIGDPYPPGTGWAMPPAAAIAQVNADMTRATMRRWEARHRAYREQVAREHAEAIDDALRRYANRWPARVEDML